MGKYFLDRGKKMLNEGYKPTNFTRDYINSNKYIIIYTGANPDYLRRK
jgi:hypothetical protein